MQHGTEGGQRPVVRNIADISAHDGQLVTVHGEYRVIPMPQKGESDSDSPLEYGVIMLADGTGVFLETYNTPEAVRLPEERRRFEGKEVRVTGTAHRIMPSRGASLLAPCISSVIRIVEDN